MINNNKKAKKLAINTYFARKLGLVSGTKFLNYVIAGCILISWGVALILYKILAWIF